jgi:hypothetical protein
MVSLIIKYKKCIFFNIRTNIPHNLNIIWNLFIAYNLYGGNQIINGQFRRFI